MPTDEPTPGELLLRALEERKLGKSEFARMLRNMSGREYAYHNVYRWGCDREFTSENRRWAALALDLPSNYFEQLDEVARAERADSACFDAFLKCAIAERLSGPQMQVIRSFRFPPGPFRPTVRFYELVAYALLSMDGT